MRRGRNRDRSQQACQARRKSHHKQFGTGTRSMRSVRTRELPARPRIELRRSSSSDRTTEHRLGFARHTEVTATPFQMTTLENTVHDGGVRGGILDRTLDEAIDVLTPNVRRLQPGFASVLLDGESVVADS